MRLEEAWSSKEEEKRVYLCTYDDNHEVQNLLFQRSQSCFWCVGKLCDLAEDSRISSRDNNTNTTS